MVSQFGMNEHDRGGALVCLHWFACVRACGGRDMRPTWQTVRSRSAAVNIIRKINILSLSCERLSSSSSSQISHTPRVGGR